VVTAPLATLNRNGSTVPRVIDWAVADAVAPFWQIKARTARPSNVLTFDQVNYVDDIIDRGAWKVDEVYRAGHLEWLPNKASCLYSNDQPADGHVPPAYAGPGTADAYWQNMTPPPTAADIKYNDGTPIENLKPAQVSATRGAPTGTPVGDRSAEAVNSQIDT